MLCKIPWPLRFAVVFLAASSPVRAEPHVLRADFKAPAGTLRPLHGVNKGPLAANGLIDVTEGQKRLRIPFTRLHDCQHPNPAVVDVHAIFPNPDADPAVPESYDFRATDEYIAAVRATGAEIIYRLGESIEHQTVKRHVHPPRDPQRWAAVCAGIVRHYNEGWANGHRYGIRYWEIWNEPENRPVMWTGTDHQFLELYRVTATALKKEFPHLKVGGPGFGYCGKLNGDTLEPSEFCTAFLQQCRDGTVPLDFFSWHCYTDNPSELVVRAKAVRRVLDACGLQRTESHLNEWNYLPGNSWDMLSRTAAPEARQRGVELMAGAPGGAFLAASLIELQATPVDVTNFFHGECGIFGLFTEVGAPTRNYYSMLAFSQMLETPQLVQVTGTLPGRLAAAAGTAPDSTRAALLLASLSGPGGIRVVPENLPWPGPYAFHVQAVDATRALEDLPFTVQGTTLELKLPPPAVARITIKTNGKR